MRIILYLLISLSAGYGIMSTLDHSLSRVDTVCQEGC